MKAFLAERSGIAGDLLELVTGRVRALVGRRAAAGAVQATDLAELGDLLLSRRGEASGVALARSLVAACLDAPDSERRAFLLLLAERFGPDAAAVEQALAGLRDNKPGALEALHAASEPRRQELFRRMNMAPGGTALLVAMRQDLLAALRELPQLAPVNADLLHLFSSWFNRGFLTLRQIDWDTPASILEKIIRFEAVHQIRNWDDLRNRLQPGDRRCYAFFHPQLVDEPLIFVEVALTTEIPAAVAPLLALDRQPIPAAGANTAVFYSITSTQRGLAGVSFGNCLIKQVVELLKADLPGLRDFVTLSPVPGFSAWLKAANIALPEAMNTPDWHKDAAGAAEASAALLPLAARYFIEARDAAGRVADPVARFHLGNGARLERLNPMGDLSANGLRQSHGLMVNYLYAPGNVERNHDGFAEAGMIAASDAIRRLLPAPPAARKTT